MPLKLKTVTIDNKTYAEVVDGKPVFIHDDGSEHPFDADGATARISSLNKEAQTHRQAKETAEANLAKFKDIPDPEAAVAALNTVKNLDDKKLVDAGKVEEIKAAAIKAVEDKYAPVVKERDSLKGEIFGERLANRFNNSKYIAEKMAVPADVVKAVFGRHFKDENGKPVAYDQSDQKVYSRQNPGADPDFEEALAILVDAYPFKDTLLKGTGGGSGKKENNGRDGAGGDKTMSRAEFDQLPFDQRDKTIKDGVKVVD